jgi:L-asparaginase/Glu-tRNA(Gln) amidotransferase subunit D
MVVEESNMPHQKPRRLGLVGTGGTIAAVRGVEGINLADHDAVDMSLTVGLDDCELLVRTPCHILSENARPEHWRLIANAALELVVAGVDGIVITHGTDTLAYTAAALSFVLHPAPVPVILTGAMLPADDPDTDGPDNLRWSARIALHPTAPREVAVLFGGGSATVAAYYAGTDQFYAGYAGAGLLDKMLIRGTCVKKVTAWPAYFAPKRSSRPARRCGRRSALSIWPSCSRSP